MKKAIIATLLGGAIALAGCGTVSTTGKPTNPLGSPSSTWTIAPVVTEPANNFTAGQNQAIKKAQSYLRSSAFSRSGLIKQLEYEKFSTADSTFAVDNITVDWNEQAVKKAHSYLRSSSFSKSGLVAQLEYEGFTAAQAQYGADTAYRG